ncbi:MAG: type 4a pilus biogenesis protein PilO [Candidatus Doudnabacteria bacterium]|nr:type 4a pilus biogenesis protein PilO [Candidatus Doudnabacteria bacterium]
MPRGSISARINKILETKQGQAYAVAAGTAAVVIVLIGFGIFPILSSIFFVSEQNAIKQQVLDSMTVKEQNLRGLVSKEFNNRAVTLALKAAMPDQLEQAVLIEKVTNLAALTGLQINLMSFTELETKIELRETFDVSANLQGKSFSMSAYGSRSGIEGFVTGVESMHRVVNIQTLTVGRRDDEDLQQGGQLGKEYKLDLQGEIYFIAK